MEVIAALHVPRCERTRGRAAAALRDTATLTQSLSRCGTSTWMRLMRSGWAQPSCFSGMKSRSRQITSVAAWHQQHHHRKLCTSKGELLPQRARRVGGMAGEDPVCWTPPVYIMPPPPPPLSLWDHYPAAFGKFLSAVARWRARRQYLKTCWWSELWQKGCHFKAVLCLQISISASFSLCFIIAKRSLINDYYTLGCLYLLGWTARRENRQGNMQRVPIYGFGSICKSVRCIAVGNDRSRLRPHATPNSGQQTEKEPLTAAPPPEIPLQEKDKNRQPPTRRLRPPPRLYHGGKYP